MRRAPQQYAIYWPEPPRAVPVFGDDLPRGKNLKQLSAPFVFYGVKNFVTYRVTAPAGMVIDGPSVHPFFQCLGVILDSRSELAAWPHDIGYYADVMQWEGRIGRATLDLWYALALQQNGYHRRAVAASYLALLRRGQVAYRDVSAIDEYNAQRGVVCTLESGVAQIQFTPDAAEAPVS